MEVIIEMVLRQLGVSMEATDSGEVAQGEEIAAGSTQGLQSSDNKVLQSAANMRLPPEAKGSHDPVAMETEGDIHAENLQAPGGPPNPAEPVFVSYTLFRAVISILILEVDLSVFFSNNVLG